MPGPALTRIISGVVEEDALIGEVVTDEIEASNADVIAGDGLSIDETTRLAARAGKPRA
jgi:hypothetical protein